MNNLPFKALIFDLDGTLTVPTLDFQVIRREIGIPSGDLTSEIARFPAEQQESAWAVVRRHEEQAMERQELQAGSKELLDECHRMSIKLGLVTRNEKRSVDHLCLKYGLHFDMVITREFPFVKPHPQPVIHMLREWSIEPQYVLVIGDYLYDIECGRAAGTRTCFFQNRGTPFYGENADYVVSAMNELERIVFCA